jgi:hypothetical protein
MDELHPIELILYRAIGSIACCERTDATGDCFPEADKPEESDYATENSDASKHTGNFITV